MNLKVCLLLVFFSVGATGRKSNPSSSIQNAMTENNKKTLLALVNEARAKGCKCGTQRMPPAGEVTWNEQLEAAATKHSADMFRHSFLRHEGSDGSTLATRISGEGFKWKSCAENIAEGYETEQQVIEGWLKSPAHCRNLMNPDYHFMGVARAGNYWTQDFAGR